MLLLLLVWSSHPYALIGRSCSPLFKRSLPTTQSLHSDDVLDCHGEGQEEDGTAHHYGLFEMPCGAVVLCCYTELEVLEVCFDLSCDVLWDFEEAESCPKDLTGD